MGGEEVQQGLKASQGVISDARRDSEGRRSPSRGDGGAGAAEGAVAGSMYRSAIFERVVAASVGGLLVGLLGMAPTHPPHAAVDICQSDAAEEHGKG